MKRFCFYPSFAFSSDVFDIFFWVVDVGWLGGGLIYTSCSPSPHPRAPAPPRLALCSNGSACFYFFPKYIRLYMVRRYAPRPPLRPMNGTVWIFPQSCAFVGPEKQIRFCFVENSWRWSFIFCIYLLIYIFPCCIVVVASTLCWFIRRFPKAACFAF